MNTICYRRGQLRGRRETAVFLYNKFRCNWYSSVFCTNQFVNTCFVGDTRGSFKPRHRGVHCQLNHRHACYQALPSLFLGNPWQHCLSICTLFCSYMFYGFMKIEFVREHFLRKSLLQQFFGTLNALVCFLSLEDKNWPLAFDISILFHLFFHQFVKNYFRLILSNIAY